jgi:serine/threonine protein kinase
MELLQGAALADELKTRGALPLRRCLRIAVSVAEVLAAAHRQGVLHRDIKPENVFLHRGEDGEVVKVVDFGIARVLGDAPNAARLTQTGEFMGTPSFVAPERMGRGNDDGRSDVYSLGAMLYNMVCGELPWDDQRLLKVVLGVADDSPPPPMSASRADVPPQLESLVRRALAWKPEDRPTASEMAASLASMVELVGGEEADDVPFEQLQEHAIPATWQGLKYPGAETE